MTPSATAAPSPCTTLFRSTLAGGTNATGTISFSVFSTADCSGPATAGGSATVTGNGAYNSDAVQENGSEAYPSKAAYPSDANYSPLRTARNDTGETNTVGASSATTTTTH